MNTIAQTFRNYLLIENHSSAVTVKNYTADLNKFIKWFETIYGKPFEPSDLTTDVINSFFESFSPNYELLTTNSGSAPRSLARYTSTLRRLSHFLIEKGYTETNPFDQLSILNSQLSTSEDPWKLKSFKNYLSQDGASRVTTKNYMADIRAFTTYMEDETSELTLDAVNRYKDRLISILNMSPRSVNRKLSSIRKYMKFAGLQNLEPQGPKILIDNDKVSSLSLDDINSQTFNSQPRLNRDQQSLINNQYSPVPPLRLIQKLSEPYLALEDFIANLIVSKIHLVRLKKMSTATSAPWHKRLLHHARFTRPEWYKSYHRIAITHYFHLAVLIIYVFLLGTILYKDFINDASQNKTFASTPSSQVLSFKGRLTNSENEPVTSPTDVRFLVYADPTASGAALLWQEVQNIRPNTNGEFTTTLGKDSQDQLQSITQGFDSLYLGISVASSSELKPRDRLGIISYAKSAGSIAGMLPITDISAPASNTLLALDSSGNLTMGGSSSPTFQASGGQFKLSGQGLVLATNTGTGSDIRVIPDGLGRIDLEAPLVNNGTSGYIANGGVEINDRAAVFATESAVAAFIVSNNTTGGDIFAASSSGETRFVITNTGNINLQPGTSIDTLSTGTISIGSTNATGLSLGRIGQAIIFPGLSSSNGILYGSHGTGELSQLTTETPGKCLISGPQGQPVWGDCWSNTASISGSLTVLPTNGPGIHIKSSKDTDLLRLEDSDGTCDHNPEAGSETVTCSSDERLKSNIVDAESVLEELMKIRVRTYTVNASGENLTGVVAQEVQKVAPQMVNNGSDGFLKVALPSPWVLLKAIQEVNSKIDANIQNLTQIIYNQQSIINGPEIVSPLASIDRIHTNIISPLANSSEVHVKGNLAIDGSATISGNLTTNTASISGELIASSSSFLTSNIQNLKSNDATISGTLYANNIRSNSIEGLDDRIATISSQTISNYREQLAIAAIGTASAVFNGQMSIVTGQMLALSEIEGLDIETISSDFATFREGLIALGPSTFTDASVLNNLTISNNLTIGGNSIDTLGSDLEIQPLKQGAVSFLAGLVRIETDGNLKVMGNAEFAQDITVHGKVRANVISPLPDQDSVNIDGDLVASGSGTFDKLKLSLVEPVYAISDTEVVATGSAGTAAIKSYRTELTIDNPNITDRSLIYITPVGTNNQVLNLLRQVPEDPALVGIEGSFTVGLDTPAPHERQFNWIIVN